MKKGDAVTVLSGARQGQKGTVTNVPRKWVLVQFSDGKVENIKASDLQVEGG